MSINVVKRPFKSGGVFYAAGDLINDPAAIRLFRTKVNEGKIVSVDEHNAPAFIDYLLHKQGVDARSKIEEALQGIKTEVPEEVKEPEVPKEPEAVKEPEVPKEPEAVKEPEVPKEPEVVKEPEVPKEPEVHDTPKVPEQPKAPRVPSTKPKTE